MIKFLLATVFSVFVLSVQAQSPFGEIKLEAKEDYKAAEQKVLEASNLLFTTKYDKDDLDRLYAMELIEKWMTGTPDYTFEIGEKFSKAFSSDADLLGMYMAAMAKYALENKEKAGDNKSIGLGATKMLIEYSSKLSNNLRQSGELKKMSAALKKGELEKYLGI